MATTSCDVIPAGLSTRASPSVRRVLIRRRLAAADLLEQRLDPRGFRDALIALELDLGRRAKPQRLAEARAEMRREALKSGEGGFLFRVAPHHAHEHFSRPQIARHLHAGDGDN